MLVSEPRHRFLCMAVSVLSLSVLAALYSRSVATEYGSQQEGAKDRRPLNVLLITVDTLRADRLGCYGYNKDTSPNVDRIAKEGTAFLNVMAPRGLTVPSLTTIMTGQYPVTHGVRGNSYKLPEDGLYLAEVLKEKGYTCGAFLANELTWDQLWQGFDAVEKGDDEFIVKRALDWLETPRAEPFFGWILLYSPHRPFTPPVEYGAKFDPAYMAVADGDAQDFELNGVTLAQGNIPAALFQSVQAMYDGEVAYSDALIARLVGALDAKGMKENSLVIITGDHGEELGDHFKYFYHFASVYGSSLHVPLIVRLPGVAPASARIPDVVENIRIGPTILDLLGVEPPKTYQGKSLLPLMLGRNEEAAPAVSEYQDQMLSVRLENYRLIHNPKQVHLEWINEESLAGRQGMTLLPYKAVELYDLQTDPGEQKNIAAENPQKVKTLVATLQAWMKTYGWKFDGKDETLVDDGFREKAEAIGYLGD